MECQIRERDRKHKVVRNRYNTPVIIKYPFWRMTAQNKAATYACINYGEAVCPEEIAERSIVINGDVGKVVEALHNFMLCYQR